MIFRLQPISSKAVSTRDKARGSTASIVAFLCLVFLADITFPSEMARAEIPSAQPSKGADFRGEAASNDARQLADWVMAQGDNQSLPFIIVDKVNAKVFVFDAAGLLRGAAPVLLGLTRGDDTPIGIGSRKLSGISAGERITPAGRFVTSAGRNLAKKDILWIDYASSLSLHPVITSNISEHRLQRLQTPSTRDNRISFGCINVPADFYESVIKSTLTYTSGVTYILPEIKSIYQVFSINRQAAHHRVGR